jgi:REP element-mobilizing transposase RayT
MILNKIGKFAEKYWIEIPNHNSLIELDYYVVMPNHLHGILILDNVETTGPVVSNKTEAIHRIASTTLQANSLGSIIGQFKLVCTKRIRKSGHPSFHWQPRFYDRIIRNDRELYQIRKYIEQNPLKWDIEKNIPDNLYNF